MPADEIRRWRHNARVTSPARRPPTVAVVVALLTVYVLWGSTYLGIAVMIETMPPLLAAGARYGSAGLIMLAVLVAHARLRPGQPWSGRPRSSGAQPRSSARFCCSVATAAWSSPSCSSRQASPRSLVATVPIWLAVFDAIVTRRRPSGLVIGGLVAGIAGVAVLLVPVEGFGEIDPLGIALVLGGAIAWAIGSLYARYNPLPRSALLGTGMEMLLGGVALIIGGVLLGEVGRTDVAEFSTSLVVAFVYLVVFGSIVAFTAYTWLLANVPVSTVSDLRLRQPRRRRGPRRALLR